MPKIKAILFDMDGTLRDSRHAINTSAVYAFGQQGVQVTDEQMAPYAHSLRAIHSALGADTDYDQFKSAYYAKLPDLLPTIKLYDMAQETLEALHQTYRFGLVSSSLYAKESIEVDGLAHLFDAVVGGNDTVQRKPLPDPVLLALEQLGVVPAQAVMVGDLAADIQSGLAAKVAATIGLTHGFGSRQMLEEAKADYIIDSFAELRAILDTIEQSHGPQDR